MGITTVFFFNAIKYLFLMFLGICACVVLIKLAFGTLHIHVTVDNLNQLIGKEAVADDEMTEESTKIVEAQQKELERFKELLRSRKSFPEEVIEKLTYEDLLKFKEG